MKGLVPLPYLKEFQSMILASRDAFPVFHVCSIWVIISPIKDLVNYWAQEVLVKGGSSMHVSRGNSMTEGIDKGQ